MPAVTLSEAKLDALREEVRRLEGSRPPMDAPLVISTGISSLDRILPECGLKAGSLTEWLTPSQGSGAGLLALLAAKRASREGGVLVVIDRSGRFYPPGAAALGVDLDRLILVRPSNAIDERWVWDQALRCEGVSAVWGLMDERIDDRTFRRWQLASESQHALGLLVRSAKWLGQPSWADVQLLVEPRASTGPRRLRVELTRGRRHVGAAVELAIDEARGMIEEAMPSHETHPLPLASELAHPAIAIKPA